MINSKQMSQCNHFVFWEDMWNESKEDLKESCCGKWDEFGKCNCKKEYNKK